MWLTLRCSRSYPEGLSLLDGSHLKQVYSMSFLGSQASLTPAMTAESESQQALEVQSHALREGGGTWSQSSSHFLWPTPRTVVSLEALADGYSPDGHLGTPIHTSPGKPLGPQLLRQRRVLCPGCRLSTLRGPAPACLGLGGRTRATPAECQGAHWSASETRHRTSTSRWHLEWRPRQGLGQGRENGLA